MSYNPNYTDSAATVIHLLAAFEDMCRLKLPHTEIIYDQQLSYETAIEALFNKNNFNQLAEENKPDGLFTYSRTVLEDSPDGAGSRVRNMSPSVKLDDGSVFNYKAVYGEFDINFLYTAHNIEDVYKFETFYSAAIGFGEKNLSVNLTNIGDFTYYLKYLPLTDIQASSGSPDVTYKVVGGTIRARGVFFTFFGSKNSVAKLNLRLFDKADPLVNSILIDKWSKP